MFNLEILTSLTLKYKSFYYYNFGNIEEEICYRHYYDINFSFQCINSKVWIIMFKFGKVKIIKL